MLQIKKVLRGYMQRRLSYFIVSLAYTLSDPVVVSSNETEMYMILCFMVSGNT